MTEDQPRRGPGRPATGHDPVRSIRMGDVWERARAAAVEDGEPFAALVEQALERELARRDRARRRPTG